MHFLKISVNLGEIWKSALNLQLLSRFDEVMTFMIRGETIYV